MPAESDLNKPAGGVTASDIPREAVLAALEAVVSSAPFSKAKRPARFLRFLVETALRGDGQVLKESVLGTEVFERPADWDPRLDPVVRQEAARLRKRLATYYETSGADAEVRIDLPVGSYVPLFRRKSVEPEATPPETPVPAPAAAAIPRRPLWPYIAAGILCLAAVVLIWRAAATRASAASIVVLPFTDDLARRRGSLDVTALSRAMGERQWSSFAGLRPPLPDLLSRAIAVDSLAGATTRMIGPLLGGFVYATMGLAGSYAVTTALTVMNFILAWPIAHSQAARRLSLPGAVRDLL